MPPSLPLPPFVSSFLSLSPSLPPSPSLSPSLSLCMSLPMRVRACSGLVASVCPLSVAIMRWAMLAWLRSDRDERGHSALIRASILPSVRQSKHKSELPYARALVSPSPPL
eukprot:5058502-Alexandrium_andersonii.AAC.1